MTDVEKLLALITIQAATMTKPQRAACNEAWLKMLATVEETDRLAYKPAFAPRSFLPADDTDGDDDYRERQEGVRPMPYGV